MKTTVQVPSDYAPGYEQACAVNPEVAANYINHMHIGDVGADALMDGLNEMSDWTEALEYIQKGMDDPTGESIKGAPAFIREFFEDLNQVPDWVDLPSMADGIRMFHRNSKTVLASKVAGVLIEGFCTNIAKSFFITGRVRDNGVRRLQNNNRHMVEIFIPGGLERLGDGWKLSVRVRLMHAQARYLLKTVDDWDHAAWGLPLSSAHVGFAISAFSARLIHHMNTLGARFTEEERRSFMKVWRYSGHLMGVPDTILFQEETDALELFHIARMCEPPSMESRAMAHSLVNSAPLLIGMADQDRKKLSKYVFRVSRALIGDEYADSLNYPQWRTTGVIPWLRTQNRYQQVMRFLSERFNRATSFATFSGLLEVSAYEVDGISYKLPNRVYAEESKY